MLPDRMLFDREIEVAPIVKQWDNGAVFQGAGNSHFTVEHDRFHVTTEIPDLRQGVRIADRFDVNPDQF